jgi:hypothetical protein
MPLLLIQVRDISASNTSQHNGPWFLDAPESTGPRSLASTSSVISSSSSKKLKAGAIAGVVIGGKLDCLYRYTGH